MDYKERYKRLGESEWFKKHYEGKSLGDCTNCGMCSEDVVNGGFTCSKYRYYGRKPEDIVSVVVGECNSWCPAEKNTDKEFANVFSKIPDGKITDEKLKNMTREDISLTKVWRINDSILVIAETIPLAIKIYKTRYDCNDVEKVELVKGKWDCDYALMIHKYEDEL